jgi:hypothetical protein
MALDESAEREEDTKLKLKVKTCDGKSIELDDIPSLSTILEVKKLCASRCGVAANHQRLHFKGKALEDTRSIADIKVPQSATLFLTKAPSWKIELEKAPAGTVPCAGGCGHFGTSRTDNFCSKCFCKQPHQERARLWSGIFSKDFAEEMETKRSKLEVCLEDETPLKIGDPVRIHGLSKATELNGRLGWIIQFCEKTSRFSVKTKGDEGTKAVKASNLKRLDNVASMCASKLFVQRDTAKCWYCSRKCGLTGFRCRCGYVFCSRHRHAEDHDCDFDHHHLGQELLRKANPALKAEAMAPLL